MSSVVEAEGIIILWSGDGLCACPGTWTMLRNGANIRLRLATNPLFQKVANPAQLPRFATTSLAHVDHLFHAVASSLPRRLAVALALVLALFSCASVALAARTLPPDAQFAKAATFKYPTIKVGDKTLRLAVGSRIYDQHNRILMPASAPAKANVVYKTDMNGEVALVWILTDQESQAYANKK